MRRIGDIKDELAATQIVAFLLTQEIKAIAEKQGKIGWEIWIKEEDDVSAAKEIFSHYKSSPDDPKYAYAIDEANRIAAEELKKQQKTRENIVVMRGQWSQGRVQRKPLVITLIVISIAVFLLTNGFQYSTFGGSGPNPEPTVVLKALLHNHPDEVQTAIINYSQDAVEDSEEQGAFEQSQELREVQAKTLDSYRFKFWNIGKGEYWRIFTPMFIHFGFLHIIFNMMWLNSLGGQLENRYGTMWFAAFVLLAAAASDLLQVMMPTDWQGSSAITMGGGMSGVNYALAGFLWYKSKFEPESGLFLSPVSMFILVVWMLMGFAMHEKMSMANWAHGGGLAFGLAAAYVPGFFKRKPPQQKSKS